MLNIKNKGFIATISVCLILFISLAFSLVLSSSVSSIEDFEFRRELRIQDYMNRESQNIIEASLYPEIFNSIDLASHFYK
jgi:hypothetical protein